MCRWTYNYFLEQRKNVWEKEKRQVKVYDQQNQLPCLKISYPQLSSIYSQVLCDITNRIELAYQAFFRRLKQGQTPGYPRFKSIGQYNSFTYNQPPRGASLQENRLHLSKIGELKIVLSRPLGGTCKRVTIKRERTGKWYATFSCNVPPKQLPSIPTQTGLDLGITSFATTSEGQHIENPRFFKHEQKALARQQKKFSKSEKGSRLRKKLGKRVCKIHERVKDRRSNFTHQTSRKLVNEFGTIFVEDLNIRSMLEESGHRCLHKSISDAAWSAFLCQLACKAEWAGRRVIKVNPAYTSRTCLRGSCSEHDPLRQSLRVSLLWSETRP